MPRKTSNTLRSPERDYSHRLLLDKLGIKPGQRISVLGIHDKPFLKNLADRVPDYERENARAEADIIVFGAEELKSLAQMNSLAGTIQKSGQKAGSIWVVYPKGKAHIREADVRSAGKACGLVDNKVCRFSATHTALRFVIPLARR